MSLAEVESIGKVKYGRYFQAIEKKIGKKIRML